MFPRGVTFDDVLLVPGYNGIRSRQAVSTDTQLGRYTLRLPVLSANMDTITGAEMAITMARMGGLGILHRFMSIEANVEEYRRARAHGPVGVSVGVTGDSMARAEALLAAGADIICVDVAHGHSKQVNRMVRDLRDKFGDGLCIIAGNVATYAGADYLAAAGADVIKVGIGPGSACTTRMKTGFGVPQLSAILDCRKVDRPIIADGGIRTPGDAVKALAAGATFVMLGGMLAGCEETPGPKVRRVGERGEERFVKVFRGMASREAQEEFMGQMADWKTAEGVAIEVPVRGSAADVLSDLMGGIRSGLTYCGATDIRSLQRKAQFMEVSRASFEEGSPHGVGRLGEGG